VFVVCSLLLIYEVQFKLIINTFIYHTLLNFYLQTSVTSFHTFPSSSRTTGVKGTECGYVLIDILHGENPGATHGPNSYVHFQMLAAM